MNSICERMHHFMAVEREKNHMPFRSLRYKISISTMRHHIFQNVFAKFLSMFEMPVKFIILTHL